MMKISPHDLLRRRIADKLSGAAEVLASKRQDLASHSVDIVTRFQLGVEQEDVPMLQAGYTMWSGVSMHERDNTRARAVVSMGCCHKKHSGSMNRSFAIPQCFRTLLQRFPESFHQLVMSSLSNSHEIVLSKLP
jgi:hypothetical protein